jgi:tetratricopeptide (TPR) repeat protein
LAPNSASQSATGEANEAIRLSPLVGSLAYIYRAQVWRSKRDYNKALADLDEAVRRSPKFPHASADRAWLLATCPDAKYRNGREAVELAKEACEQDDWRDAKYIGTLAAAYAEAGDFDKAVETQVRANAMTDDEDARKKGKARLERYKRKMPYRDEPETP